ncbi:MAG TPA: extracellular solute-binding protein, partial [Planctomycetota bacterium]|nr:extracellular solute-binding protein [Planctomycetota bacterium]
SGIVYHSLFFYNKALSRKLGVTKMPETWDEFKQLCDKAKDEHITPIMLDSAYEDMIADVLMVNALPEGQLRKTVTGAADAKPFTDPSYIRIFALERELADKYFQPHWQASKWPAAQQDFATGKGLFVLCGSWLPGELRTVAVKDPAVFDLSVMPVPHFNDQPKGTFNIECSGWMVLKDGGQRDGAIKLLQFLSEHWGRVIALEDGNPVSFARDPLPPDLNDIAGDIHNMKRAANEPVAEYGAKWKAYVYMQLHRDFFQAVAGDKEYITPEEFAAKLQKATEEYRARGGEAYWQ